MKNEKPSHYQPPSPPVPTSYPSEYFLKKGITKYMLQ